jgi:copper resistance protein C
MRILSILLIAVSLLAATQSALAHEVLPVETSPGMYATVDPSVTQVMLTFPEALNPAQSSVTVINIDNVRVDLDDSLVMADRPEVLVVGLPAGLQPGFYAVTWDIVIAAEYHRSGGRYVFWIAEPSSA